MTFNPYEILGVGQKAGEVTILRKFRALVKKVHPDVRGGDQNKFIAAKKARDILLDPKKRELYDVYQLVEGEASCELTFEALKNLRSLFVSFLAQVPLSDLSKTNVIDKLQDHLTKFVAQTEEQLQTQKIYMNQQKKALEVIERRLKLKKKNIPNIFVEAFAEMLTQAPAKIATLDRSLKVTREQLRILQDFSYEADLSSRAMYSTFTTVTLTR